MGRKELRRKESIEGPVGEGTVATVGITVVVRRFPPECDPPPAEGGNGGDGGFPPEEDDGGKGS